jgi:hypothetical protein
MGRSAVALSLMGRSAVALLLMGRSAVALPLMGRSAVAPCNEAGRHKIIYSIARRDPEWFRYVYENKG